MLSTIWPPLTTALFPCPERRNRIGRSVESAPLGTTAAQIALDRFSSVSIIEHGLDESTLDGAESHPRSWILPRFLDARGSCGRRANAARPSGPSKAAENMDQRWRVAFVVVALAMMSLLRLSRLERRAAFQRAQITVGGLENYRLQLG